MCVCVCVHVCGCQFGSECVWGWRGRGRYLGVRISLYCSFSTLVVAATDMGITMLLMSKELSPRRLLMGCCSPTKQVCRLQAEPQTVTTGILSKHDGMSPCGAAAACLTGVLGTLWLAEPSGAALSDEVDSWRLRGL